MMKIAIHFGVWLFGFLTGVVLTLLYCLAEAFKP